METSDSFLSKMQPTSAYPSLSGGPSISFDMNFQHAQLELYGLSAPNTQKCREKTTLRTKLFQFETYFSSTLREPQKPRGHWGTMKSRGLQTAYRV